MGSRFYFNTISEVAYHHFCHTLFLRRESLSLVSTQGEKIIQDVTPKKQGSLGTIKKKLHTEEVIVAEAEWAGDIAIENEVREVKEESDHAQFYRPLYGFEFKRITSLLWENGLYDSKVWSRKNS